ncbi:hypothetical protein CR513_17047, partial [Mucuna pruriens]
MVHFLHGLNKGIHDIMELHDNTSLNPYLLLYIDNYCRHNIKSLGKGHTTSQYLNKRTMIHGKDGDIDSDSSHEEMLTFASDGYSSEEVPLEGDLLMVKRFVSAFIKDL